MRFISWNKIGRFALFVAIITLFAVSANAQSITSATSSTSLSLSIAESLTVSATPSSITFNNYSYTAGTAAASSPITVVTTGNLAAGHGFVVTFGYLGSATAALSGPSNIPSSDVFANVDGSGVEPCTSPGIGGDEPAGMVAGAICPSASAMATFTQGGELGFQQNPPAGAYSQTDSVVLSLAGAPNLAPGAYSGTITFIAAAY